MRIRRRVFAALSMASCFFPFLRRRSQPKPVECVYESDEPSDDLPDQWLLLGADASPRRLHTESAFNLAFARRIDLERIDNVLIATIWPKGSMTPFDPQRSVVEDLPRLLEQVGDRRLPPPSTG